MIKFEVQYACQTGRYSAAVFMSNFPLRQVSWGTVISNGSMHQSQLTGTPILWWMDIPISMQLVCERALHQRHRTHVHFPGDPLELTNHIHLFDISSMTVLNMNNGELRNLRRKLISDLKVDVP